jgi:hypothetical protein
MILPIMAFAAGSPAGNFTQGAGYQTGKYDLTAPQPTAHNWTRQSRFNGAAEGDLKWKYSTGNCVSSSPAIGLDGTIYVGSDDKNLYAICSKNTDLLTVLNQSITTGTGNQIDPKKESISVDNTAADIKISDIKASDSNATINFYGTDSSFSTEETGSVNLSAGNNEVYVKITAQDGTTTQYYKVSINRAAKSAKTLIPDTTDNDVDHDIDVTFGADVAFQAAITGVSFNGHDLTANQYNVSSDRVTLKPSCNDNGYLRTPGTGTVVIKAAGYKDSAVSQTINAGAVASLEVTTQPGVGAVSGDAFATQPVVTLKDQYGNICSTGTSATANAAASAKAGTGSWTIGGTVTKPAVGGVVTFDNLTCTLAAAGSGAITFTSGIPTVDSNNFTIPATPATVPDAPTSSVQNDANNTFGWTNVIGYSNVSDYEYSLDGGTSWTVVIANPQSIPDGNYAIGKVQVRVKADTATGRTAGAALSSTIAYTATPYTPPYIPPYIPPYVPPTPQPTTETRQVPVVVENGGQQSTAVQTTITRTTDTAGSKKDTVKFDESTADAIIKKASETKTSSAAIDITDIPGNNADKVEAQLPEASMTQFANSNMSLTLQTGKVSLEVPAETINKSKGQDTTVQISEEKDSSKIADNKGLVLKLASGSQIITPPLNIEANFTGRVKITIPIDASKLPSSKEELENFISSLAVMVHHSDGEDVVDKGTIAYDEKGNVVGISIYVDKFSSFTLIEIPKDYFQGKTTAIKDKVATDKEWQIKFTKAADAATVTKDNVYVVDSKGNKVDVKVSYGSDNILKVAPVNSYTSGETYYLYISSKVTSKDKTPLAEDLRYEFVVK